MTDPNADLDDLPVEALRAEIDRLRALFTEEGGESPCMSHVRRLQRAHENLDVLLVATRSGGQVKSLGMARRGGQSS